MMTLKKLLCLSAVTCGLCLGLTGCGNSDKGSTSGNNDNNVVEDVADNVGDAAKDVADGVGNAVDDLVGANGFDNYDDAHKYFLETMGNYHTDAKFEIREEDRNLADYQEGSKGYRFKLYDTSTNQDGELFGEFYVDADTGVIYQADGDNFIEYRGTTTDNTTGNNNAKNPTDTKAGTTGNASSTNESTGNGNAGNTNGGNAGTTR